MEQPTYEEVSEMVKAITLGTETDLDERYPETFAKLLDQINEIGDAGQVVDGLA